MIHMTRLQNEAITLLSIKCYEGLILSQILTEGGYVTAVGAVVSNPSSTLATWVQAPGPAYRQSV